jgi:glycosyltransferase involved in cell wall biosynthesis
MIRLLLDVTAITNDMTGVSRYGMELIREILKHSDIALSLIVAPDLKKDHELFAITLNHNVQFHPLVTPGIGPGREWAFFKFARKVKGQYDVFHSITSNAPLAFAKKGVATFHDLKYILYPHYLGDAGLLKSLFIKWQFYFICRLYPRITCSSQSTLNDLLRTYPGMAQELKRKAHVVYLGLTPLPVNLPFVPLPYTDKPYAIYVGELRPHKNIANMIQAFETFAKKTNFDGRFLIGGKPHKTFDLKPSDERVKFLGRVSDHDLGHLYAQARALFFASRYEGFGLPILEAMHLNVPVITSNISSMPEVAGDAALIVDPDDIEGMALALEKLLIGDQVRQELQAKHPQQLSKFSWQKCSSQMITHYREVVKT